MSNRYIRLSVAALVALGTASGSAAAVEIKSLSIAPSGDAFDQKPVIHVRASSGKWTRASTDKVWFNVRISGRASGASFDFVVFGVPKVRSDAGPNSSHPNNWVIRVNDDSFSNPLRLSAKGTQLGIMTREAVAACSRLYSNGKRPDRDHTLRIGLRQAQYPQHHQDRRRDLARKRGLREGSALGRRAYGFKPPAEAYRQQPPA
jgi:hypothetical protein